MLTHRCVGYFKVINVQNDHHRHSRTIENSVEESSILVLLLVEKQHRQFYFYVSAPAMFLVLWHTHCALEHSTGRSLEVLSQEIRVNTPVFPLHRIHLLEK
jgi:hypothetical protein